MRVAIDSGPLSGGHSVRGVGVSTKGLVGSLLEISKGTKIKIEPVDFASHDLSGYDILHYTSFNPYFLNFPRIGSVKVKTVLTIHDLIPLIYKKQYPPGLKGSLRFFLNRMLVNKADAIITVSETSKKDIVRLMGITESKIDVIYWGIDEAYKSLTDGIDFSDIKKLYKLPEKFVLYVGDVNYNKNISTLIESTKITGIPLVIVGKQAVNIDELTASWKNLTGPRDLIRTFLGKPHPELTHFNRLKALIGKNKVITTGYVPVTDLVKIYNLASVYCQPSYYEGFGIPVLEAFACETPVVISKTQALTEIAGGAALIADPDSPEDMASKISSLINDSTKRLHNIRAGKTRSKEFTWEKTARKTLEVYGKVYGK